MDKNIVTGPTFLDGPVTTEGKGKGAKMTDLAEIEHAAMVEYHTFLREKQYRFYITKPGYELTNEDYDVLWQCESERGLELLKKRNFKKWWELIERESQIFEMIDMDASHNAMEAHLLKVRAEAKKKNHASHELGAREFTFTYSPKWCSDEEARDLMRKAISKLIKYYSDEIIQLRAVGEVGSNGLSHVHCFYKLRGGLKITDKNFKRAYKFWNPKKVTSRTGHEGGHHANVRIESDFQGYIDKDVEVAWMDVYFPDADPTA